MATIDIPLKHPVTIGGQIYDRLQLRRPKARDLKALQDGRGTETERVFALIRDLAEVPIDVVEELDAEDFGAVNAELGKVLPQAPTPDSNSAG